MKLIDADELIEDIKVERVNLYMEGLRGTPRSYEYLNQLQNKLEDAETVDAIPIKWIEEQIKLHGDYEESWNYQQLIDDWRKANEID